MSTDPRDDELAIPASVYGDPNPREILRAWAAHGELHTIFNPRLWDDPTDWGAFLVDIARHVSRAYEKEGVCKSDAAFAKIKSGFDVECHHPDRGITEPAPQKGKGN